MKELLFGMKEKRRGKDEAKNRAEGRRSGVEGELSASGLDFFICLSRPACRKLTDHWLVECALKNIDPAALTPQPEVSI